MYALIWLVYLCVLVAAPVINARKGHRWWAGLILAFCFGVIALVYIVARKPKEMPEPDPEFDALLAAGRMSHRLELEAKGFKFYEGGAFESPDGEYHPAA